MSLINKEIVDFKVQAFVDGEFREITKADVLGKWSVFFFYPADFTFVCPTELEDLADKYADFKNIDCEIYSVSCDTHLCIKHGMMHLILSRKLNIQCLQIQQDY